MQPRLLILDDEESIRQLLSTFFDKQGYVVVALSTAGEAIEVADREQFDLAILDINLAGENGLELLRFFKSNFPKLPVIVSSGRPAMAIRSGAIAGAYVILNTKAASAQLAPSARMTPVSAAKRPRTAYSTSRMRKFLYVCLSSDASSVLNWITRSTEATTRSKDGSSGGVTDVR